MGVLNRAPGTMQKYSVGVLSLLMLQLALGQSTEVRTPVAVVMTSKRPGAEAVAPKIAQRVFDSFKREGVGGLLDDAATAKEVRSAGFSDPKSCQGTRACLGKLAILLGPKAVVVGIDVGKVGKTLAIHLEAVSADREESLGTLDVSSSLSGWSDAMSAPIVVFVRDVKAGLELKKKVAAVEPPPPPPPLEVARTDTPKKTELVPAPKQPGSELVEEVPGKPPRVAAWVFAGGAAATAGVAVAFGVMSGNAKSQFDASLVDLGDGTKGTRLPEDQARALANQANTNAAVALTSGILSAGLTAAATIFFLKD
ncbi:MAG: hypothetical protein Q8L48_17715 [Archangium sp.]|nr:hypothetical protein [Archangium sp.]